MFGMGWAEMAIVAIVALIVVGPKELPVMFRKLGTFVGKARGMAREFSSAMNDAADQAGMKDAVDSVNSIGNVVKEPTKAWTSYKPGSETEKLAADRKAAADKVKAEADARRKQVEEANAAAEAQGKAFSEAAKAKADTKPAPKKPAAKKPATQKPAAKKPTAKTAAAKKPAAKKPAAKTAAAKKPAARKPAAKKA